MYILFSNVTPLTVEKVRGVSYVYIILDSLFLLLVGRCYSYTLPTPFGFLLLILR